MDGEKKRAYIKSCICMADFSRFPGPPRYSRSDSKMFGAGANSRASTADSKRDLKDHVSDYTWPLLCTSDIVCAEWCAVHVSCIYVSCFLRECACERVIVVCVVLRVVCMRV
jgi:hypothetical protein